MTLYTMVVPSLKYCAQLSCVNTLLELTDDGGPLHSQKMLQYLATGCYTAVSREILQRIVEFFPDRLTSEILSCLVPDHSKELCLSKCTKLTPLKTAEILRRCPHLQKLDLSGCGILVLPQTFQLLSLSQVLITHLSLEKSHFVNDEVVKSILRNMRCIQHLNISECQDITEKVFDLSEESTGNKDSNQKMTYQRSIIECSLVSIDVSYCHAITDLSIQDLVRLTGKSLRHVNITCPLVTCLSLFCLCGYEIPETLILEENMEEVCHFLNNSMEVEVRSTVTCMSQQHSNTRNTDLKVKDSEEHIQVTAPKTEFQSADAEFDHEDGYEDDIGDDILLTEGEKREDYGAESKENRAEGADSNIDSTCIRSETVFQCSELVSKTVYMNDQDCDIKIINQDLQEMHVGGALQGKDDSCKIKRTALTQCNYDRKTGTCINENGEVGGIVGGEENKESNLSCSNLDFISKSEKDRNGRTSNLVDDVSRLSLCIEEREIEEKKSCEKDKDGTDTCMSDVVNDFTSCQNFAENENSCGACKQIESNLHESIVDSKEGCSLEDISIAVPSNEFSPLLCTVNQSGTAENGMNCDEIRNDEGDHQLCSKNAESETVSTGSGDKTENTLCSNVLEKIGTKESINDDRSCESDNSSTLETDQKFEILQIYKPSLISVEVGAFQNVQSKNLEFSKILFLFFALENRDIQRFGISWSKFDDSCLDAISNNWSDLREICLLECQRLTTKAVMKLGTDCKQLRKVNLQGVTFIHDVAVVPFMKTGNLVNLNLAECNITDVVLIELAAKSMATLESLDLSWCDEEVTQRGLNVLCSKEGPNLKSLSLRMLPATNLTLALIAKNLWNLRSINLSSVKAINNESIISLVKSLRLLDCIDLSWNVDVGDEAVETVLIYCTLLNTLVLSGLKRLTSTPFFAIISDIKQWKRCKSLLQYKHKEREILREMKEEHLSSDEEYEELHMPYRSTTYAANLKFLSLEYCDGIDDQKMQEIVAICRGSLKIVDYYSEDLEPILLGPKNW